MRMVWLVILLTACKSDPVKCEKAIRNYATLVFWDGAEKEINAVPPDKRDALRKEKLAKFNSDMEQHLDIDVSKCTSANFETQIDCMTNATTAQQAKDCIPN